MLRLKPSKVRQELQNENCITHCDVPHHLYGNPTISILKTSNPSIGTKTYSKFENKKCKRTIRKRELSKLQSLNNRDWPIRTEILHIFNMTLESSFCDIKFNNAPPGLSWTGMIKINNLYMTLEISSATLRSII